MTATIIYKGSLRCLATHTQSGTQIETDAPTDNKGKGERFSPTDLVCVALATCIVTTIGIKAADMQIDFSNANVTVQKHMISDPRRIGKIEVNIEFENILPEKDRAILERVGHACPVARSLAPELEQVINYTWKNG
jgi:putative redox protein